MQSTRGLCDVYKRLLNRILVYPHVTTRGAVSPVDRVACQGDNGPLSDPRRYNT